MSQSRIRYTQYPPRGPEDTTCVFSGGCLELGPQAKRPSSLVYTASFFASTLARCSRFDTPLRFDTSD